MDLSFPSFVGPTELRVLPADLAALRADIAARQTASTTAGVQAALPCRAADPRPFAPVDGSFNGRVAAALAAWREG